MKKSEYLKALEYVDELDALYGAVLESSRSQQIPDDFDQRKNLENYIAGVEGVRGRLAHVRAVLEHSMTRTRGRPPISAG